MIDLVMAAALAQAGAGPDPCHAAAPAARPATCRQWRRLAGDDQVELFIDPASVRRDAAGFEIDTRIVYATPQEEEGMRSGVTTNRYDCAARTWALRHSAYYDESGTLLVEGDTSGDAADPEPVPAGSPMAGLLTEFCPR
ncbi:MAG TPA: surface-adhesin E family protein [Allosphingosinicella sp.]|nr:surface-adhesin E family protein [Allosphingosinicella sp.]